MNMEAPKPDFAMDFETDRELIHLLRTSTSPDARERVINRVEQALLTRAKALTIHRLFRSAVFEALIEGETRFSDNPYALLRITLFKALRKSEGITHV